MRIGRGPFVERYDRNGSRAAAGSRHLDTCIEYLERDGRVGRMHCVTAPARHDAVILVLAGVRGAMIAAVLEARDATPEIPAAGALPEVASEGAHVAERRTAD